MISCTNARALLAGNAQEAVPLQELYASIDRHWQAQQAVRATEVALADRAQQHRAVQKRLLMRFKDRQPTSLAHLNLLLSETFQQLLQLGADQLLLGQACWDYVFVLIRLGDASSLLFQQKLAG